MRILGILFILFSVSFTGFEIGNRYLSELNGIKRAERFLKNIILCLENENMTLREIFENSVILCDGKTKEFVSELNKNGKSDICEKALKTGFCKNKTAALVLEEVFSVLGKYSSEKQIREISFCRNKLNNLYNQNEDILRSKSKLAKISGILAGAFFAIILI